MIKVVMNIVLLFLASSLMPILSFVLPVYKIKNIPKLGSKNRLLVNVISAVIIYFIDYKLFFVYVGIFLLLEGLYYVFERTEIKVFDRILISTALTTVVGYFLMRVFIGTPNDLIAIMEKVYTEYVTIDQSTVNLMVKYIRSHLLFIIFTYLLVINYFTYFALKGKEYRKWNISYLWVIIYIVTFFMDKTLKIDNFYINNLYYISGLIYIIYGIKVLYSIFRKKIKWRAYGKVLAIVAAYCFPVVIFILGVVDSFGIIKTKNRGE